MSETLPIAVSVRSRLGSFYELTKPRLNGLVLVTVAAGVVLAEGGFPVVLLFHTILGVGLVAGAGGALNMYLERDLDALMGRTARRPLPAGEVTPGEALLFGVVGGLAGLAYLSVLVNLLTAGLAALALFNYIVLYTPLKTRSTFNTLVGAVTGALPPMMGWTAATGQLTTGGWIVFAILFVWQMPHFLAIAWFCRDDYRAAGMKMLSVFDDDEGRMTVRQMALFSLVLLPVSLLPTTSGLSGTIYAGAAIALGAALIGLSIDLVIRPSRRRVRTHFLASLLYLPILFGFMIFDRIP